MPTNHSFPPTAITGAILGDRPPFPPTAFTGAICAAARREIGLSQAALIKAGAVPAWVVKMSEANAMRIDVPHAKKLITFFESNGVDLHEVASYVNHREDSPAAEVEPAKPLAEGFTRAPRPGFMISDAIQPTLLDRLMARMEANDDRIADLLGQAFTTGLLGGISDASKANVQEVLQAMAENYVLFRCLQGRNLVTPMRGEVEKVGDYIASIMQGQPAGELLGLNEAAVGSEQ